jgi:GxxExxY protein
MFEKDLIECDEELIEKVISAAIRVHRELGPGLFESVYESALAIELEEMGIKFDRQMEVPAYYKGHNLGLGFRADIIVENCLVLELKVVKEIKDVHLAQIITYQRLLSFKRGFILNFNCKLMKDGIKRVSI